MSITIKCSLFMILGCLMLSCAGTKAISYFNENIDFGQYESFSIAGGEILKEEELGEEAKARLNKINEAISAEMTQRGYFQSESGDLEVSVRRHLSPKIEYERDRYYGTRTYSRYPNYGWSKKEFSEGKLIIEIRDGHSDKFLWHGDLDLRINKKSRNKDDIISSSIALIFSEYLFEAGKSEPNILNENKE